MTTGMSQAQYYASPLTPAERGITSVVPQLVHSDDSDADDPAFPALPAAWRSGENERDKAVADGVWEDGARVGDGHECCLEVQEAIAIHDGDMTAT